ncbi:MAG: DNA starvation/stationary phase protection protein [Candidatus Kapabacteria bacterium]|jgi:starvation-inducible DNA-binding protein|nr:DNA starvation/stationary phase protection protein [Candidatus Kapabacteria bacterium]
MKKTNKTTLNDIGIDKKLAEKLSKSLNNLLADFQVFYMNTRGFHWNIKGVQFFELHLKFEELYSLLVIKIDEIAERIQTIGFIPCHSFESYLKLSSIKSVENVSNGVKAIEHILASLSILIKAEREIMSLAQEANDEGTSALMSDYIREQEKLVWMYKAYLG